VFRNPLPILATTFLVEGAGFDFSGFHQRELIARLRQVPASIFATAISSPVCVQLPLHRHPHPVFPAIPCS
jgi:hypothetical protein